MKFCTSSVNSLHKFRRKIVFWFHLLKSAWNKPNHKEHESIHLLERLPLHLRKNQAHQSAATSLYLLDLHRWIFSVILKIQKVELSQAMAKGPFSKRATTALAIRLVTTMVILCATICRIRGFVLNPSIRIMSGNGSSSRSLLQNSNSYSESMSVPTVINPMSKRRIHLGGTSFEERKSKFRYKIAKAF